MAPAGEKSPAGFLLFGTIRMLLRSDRHTLCSKKFANHGKT